MLAFVVVSGGTGAATAASGKLSLSILLLLSSPLLLNLRVSLSLCFGPTNGSRVEAKGRCKPLSLRVGESDL